MLACQGFTLIPMESSSSLPPFNIYLENALLYPDEMAVFWYSKHKKIKCREHPRCLFKKNRNVPFILKELNAVNQFSLSLKQVATDISYVKIKVVLIDIKIVVHCK